MHLLYDNNVIKQFATQFNQLDLNMFLTICCNLTVRLSAMSYGKLTTKVVLFAVTLLTPVFK